MDQVAHSYALRAQSVTLAGWLAAVEESVAATFIRQAMSHPDRAAYLLAHSQVASERAAGLRQHYPQQISWCG